MPLSTPQISRTARRIIREAFDSLEQTVSPLEAKEFNDITLQNVQKAALEIENQLSARGSLRNMRRLMPLFKGLEHYAKCIEVLCNGTPYLPWIWAPIKLILKIASDYVEAFERIISAYSRIAESLTRFELLSEALGRSLAFQETLAIFYSDILKFHRESYTFVKRSGWKTFFLSSWGRFQRRFDTLIEDLKAHEDLVDKTANAVNIAHAAKLREQLSTWRTERLEELAKQENEDFARQYQAIVGWMKLDDADQQVIFDSIATEGAKHPGTCDWILKQKSLVSWMKAKPETPFLWLEGNPGTGKSVIATQIDTFLRKSGHSLVVRHFCKYSYTSSTQYDQILRSLLTQLIRPSVDLVAHIYGEYVLAKKAITVTALDQLILSMSMAVSSAASKPKCIHIIIDGLDECDVEKQDRAASLLQRLVSMSGSNGSTLCKVLLASRRSPVLTKTFRKKPAVSLANEKRNIALAMRTYASQKLGLIHHRLSQLGITDGDLNDISDKIVERADGMFLWTRLILEYLSSNILMTQDEVKHAINTLPRKLSEFYGKILSDITARFDARSVARMESILGWIAFCKRPLSIVEFRSALYFEQHDPNATFLPPPYIFDMCAPLIQENKDTTFSFIHVSVKEYLQSPESMVVLAQTDAQHEHALAAIRCLLNGFKVFDPTYDAHNRTLRMLSGIHGFHMHATQHWDEYLLSNFNSECRLDPSSSLVAEASALANRLDKCGDASLGVPVPRSVALDVRLQGFRHHHAIHQMLQESMIERSVAVQYLPPIARVATTHTSLDHSRSIKDLQKNFQSSLQELISLSSFPGISLNDLESFKRQFRPSAFTCLLRMCPRATVGFPDEKTMLEHDLTHTQRISCTVQGCHYPPFISPQALKAHVSKCHDGANKIPRASRISSTSASGVNKTAWDIWTGTRNTMYGITSPAPKFLFVNFAKDGNVAVLGDRKTVCLWDMELESKTREWSVEHHIHALAISPNADCVATLDNLGRFQLWDAAQGISIGTWNIDRQCWARIPSVAFSNDSKHFFTADGSVVKIWDVNLPEGRLHNQQFHMTVGFLSH
ncbi:hypothetical protein B0J13DRAFT_634785 [Dactylonectria estremocensis]|uniref:NACHT domain-containing protein n=1 Tax=Dactylonectria estremocensis TaxID=1079267 RepID=A0A9P9FM87_9HYPO|nr:hypothetical protein B0J13DRAFT_634785 [Dactylonectria estremocensis]